MTDDRLEGLETAQPAVALFHHMLGWSERTFHRKREELQDAGVIFKQISGVGKDQQPRWHAFPSKVVRWCGAKGREGDIV